MAFSYIGDGLYVGTSTDTKPTAAPSGYRAFETDTGDYFVSDGTYWWLSGMPAPNSTKKVGYWPNGASGGSGGVYLLSTLSSPTGTGSLSFVIDTTNGRYENMPSGTTSGNKGGLKTAAAVSIRGFNPRVRIKFKLATTTNTRLYMGYSSTATDLTGDDPLNALQGVLFGMSTSSATSAANWLVMHNDGSGATAVDDTTTAFDSNVHTLSLVADEANTRFAWKLDNGSYTNVTTDIPSTTTGLFFFIQTETSAASAATVQVYNAVIQTDK